MLDFELSGPALAIKDLVKFYGPLQALKGINLTLEKGELFGLLGPNGAGKSTTINIITGLGRATSGQVTVFGYDVVKDYKMARQLIGLSPQEVNLDRYFSIRQSLVFQAGYYGLSKKQAENRADELLQLFGLYDKRELIYLKLSGGLKRRVLIAKALLHSPPILILDEPTAGLDVELRHHLWRYLRELNKEGITILLTTHYIEEAQEMCGRVAIINEGQIVALDTVSNLIEGLEDGSLIIKLMKPVAGLEQLLVGPDVELLDGCCTVIIRGKERARLMSQVLKLLNDHQAEILNIDLRQGDLEDVFVKLTGRRIHESTDRVQDVIEP
jgi:ABC-2 type transport system ATP-binding protein